MSKLTTIVCLVPKILRWKFKILGNGMILLGRGILRLTNGEDPIIPKKNSILKTKIEELLEEVLRILLQLCNTLLVIIAEVIRRQNNTAERLILIIVGWLVLRLFLWSLEKFIKPIYWIIDWGLCF